MAKSKEDRSGSADSYGYLTSALVFAGFTALWAVIVRNDPYYRLVDVFGARLPATMIAYLVFAPLLGFFIGRWRYHDRHQGGAAGYLGKLGARVIHFTYVHLLIVLFTVAMATDYFLGLNIDQQVRQLDDRMFDLAARFAPWLAAYLAGFNLGRATRSGNNAAQIDVGLTAGFGVAGDDIHPERPLRRNKRGAKMHSEPRLEMAPRAPREFSFEGEPAMPPIATSPLTASGLPAAENDALPEPGFLPPQDLNKLRPNLHQLR